MFKIEWVEGKTLLPQEWIPGHYVIRNTKTGLLMRGKDNDILTLPNRVEAERALEEATRAFSRK